MLQRLIMADPIVTQNSTRMSCEVVKFLSPVAPLCGTIKTLLLLSCPLHVQLARKNSMANGLVRINFIVLQAVY